MPFAPRQLLLDPLHLGDRERADQAGFIRLSPARSSFAFPDYPIGGRRSAHG
jgi:hypothetical protein